VSNVELEGKSFDEEELVGEQEMATVALVEVTPIRAVEPVAAFAVDENAGSASADHPLLPATEQGNRQYRDLLAAG
jgi:hypothetical protein